MNPNEHIIEPTNLEAGDILLCVSEDEVAALVTAETKSKYTHAAICYSATEVADIGNCVEKTPACDFIKDYKYVAVFRGPDFWSPSRLDALRFFIDTKVNSDIKYDKKAALTLMSRQQTHRSELFEKLTDHFANGFLPKSHDKTKYICSELVIASLIAVGMWDDAMAIVYAGNTIHPGNMGHDATFGYLLGFLRADPTTVIPEDDEFACSMTNSMTFALWQETSVQMSEAPPYAEQKLSTKEIQWLLQTDET